MAVSLISWNCSVKFIQSALPSAWAEEKKWKKKKFFEQRWVHEIQCSHNTLLFCFVFLLIGYRVTFGYQITFFSDAKKTKNKNKRMLKRSSSPLLWMLLIPGTGNGERGTGDGEPGTGVWEQVYSGNPLENSKWRSKQKKRLEEKQFRLRWVSTGCAPDGQYVLVRAQSD